MTRYVRYRDLALVFGIPFSRTHIRRLIKAGEFPAPVNLGRRTIAWVETDILEHSQRILADRDERQAAKRAATNDPADNPVAMVCSTGRR